MEPSNSRLAYEAVGEEISGGLTLADLDANTVEIAREYAKRSHRKWPPAPRTTGWVVTVVSL